MMIEVYMPHVCTQLFPDYVDRDLRAPYMQTKHFYPDNDDRGLHAPCMHTIIS